MQLHCRHIRFSYPGTPDWVFKDLSVSITEPGFHALFGPSGVGKSSLAHILTGTYAAAGGKVEHHGIDTIFYSHNLERLPGWSAIGRHLDRVTPSHHSRLKESLIDVFGLSSLLGQRFGELSLGQQNRINLVRYLVQDFQMIIMDESLANVDEKMRGEIILAIKETFPEIVFLYISHNLIEVAKYCRQIWVLRSVVHTPQAVAVRGQDIDRHHVADSQAFEKTMLEMMSVA